MAIHLIKITLLVLLTGCVLNTYEKPPQKLTTPYVGAVSLVDLSTVSEKGEMAYEAQITARFTKNQSSRFEVVRRAGVSLDPSVRGIQCQLSSERRQSGIYEDSSPVSVGQVELRTMTSSSGVEIPEISPGVYKKSLSPHFASGLYLLKAAGKATQAPAFMVEFSMPEEVRGIEVNHHGLEEGPAVVQKSTDCRLEFDPPTMPSDMNIIEVLLITQQGTEQRVLACAALESDLEVINGKHELIIPSPQLSGLLATPSAELQVLRVNAISGNVSQGPYLRLDGIRAWLWPSLVAE